jgi:hypothetical protein
MILTDLIDFCDLSMLGGELYNNASNEKQVNSFKPERS